MQYAFIAMISVLIIWVVPLAAIWSINTLFPVLSIGTGLAEWAAMLVFLMMFVPKPSKR
jgi:hypothetical protein